jgi:hypothetical protein
LEIKIENPKSGITSVQVTRCEVREVVVNIGKVVVNIENLQNGKP